MTPPQKKPSNRPNYRGMRKGQRNKDIRPDKSLDENLSSAIWGRFAGTKALEAYEDIALGVGHYRSVCGEESRAFVENLPGIIGETLQMEGDALEYFVDAIKRRDAAFFRDLAEIVSLPKEREMACCSPDWAAAIAIYDAWQFQASKGKRSKDVTYAEMLKYLCEENPDFDERQLTRIVRATGMKLKRGKPGPKPWSKKTSGRGRA